MFLERFSIEREEVGEASAPALSGHKTRVPDCKTSDGRNEERTCFSLETVSLFPGHQ